MVPSLEQYLKIMAKWGDAMATQGWKRESYSKIIKGFGVRLFSGRADDERKTYKAKLKHAYTEYVNGLSDEEKNRKYAPYELPGEDENSDSNSDDSDEDESEDESDKENKRKTRSSQKKAKVKKSWFADAKAEDADFIRICSYYRMIPAWKEYKR